MAIKRPIAGELQLSALMTYKTVFFYSGVPQRTVLARLQLPNSNNLLKR